METNKKERPILFSGAMVRAILDGSKTQTRRVCKQMMQWVNQNCREVRQHEGAPHHFLKGAELPMERLHCPYGQPGDRLWVRETWADLGVLSNGNFQRQAIYRADDIQLYGDEDEAVDVTAPDMRWRPSIHMPRWASRIELEIVSVRVERLKDISEADAITEGAPGGHGSIPGYPYNAMPYEHYRHIWESINGAGSWNANPWVWVVEFKRVLP